MHPTPAHKRLTLRVVSWSACCLLALLLAAPVQAAPASIATDRTWQSLPSPAESSPRITLRAGARFLGRGHIRLAGVTLDGEYLARLAATSRRKSLRRAVRERIGRPVDLPDFLRWLDDLAAARIDVQGDDKVWMPSGRARNAGILLHPDDVFGDSPRRYGDGPLRITRPEPPASLQPAADGAPLGPRWTARFPNPDNETAMLAALEDAGHATFADHLRDLLQQFRDQGAQAWLFSTLRNRERGYLIYGAFILGRADSADEVDQRVATLDRLNQQWDLDIPIRWRTANGWQATVEAAAEMASAYNVVYATRGGARHSRHYRGTAADLAAVDLPRHLTLNAPDGSHKTFDLSAPDEPRDLNLTPRLIAWIEAHFGLRKLQSDYPHWRVAHPEN